jgi:hypothetical protein
MPFYEFYNEELGMRLLVRRKVEERDAPLVFTRDTIPATITIYGFEPTGAEAFDESILKKLYRREEREGSRFRCGEFTKEQLKDAWTGRTSPIKEDYERGQ